MNLAKVERLMLIASIISEDYLKRMEPYFKVELLQTPFSQIVAQWAWDYYGEYRVPIKKRILDAYEINEKELSDDLANLIVNFLDSISKEYQNKLFDWRPIYDQSIQFFQTQNLNKLLEDIKVHTENGNLEEAVQSIEKFKEISKEKDYGESLLEETDFSFINSEDLKPLFKYGGALGRLLNDQFIRGGFISLVAPPKRGKSFFLDDLALKAFLNRKNVALFECGDTPKKQRKRRIWGNLCRLPLKKAFCGKIMVPVLDCYYNQTNDCRKSWRENDFGVVIGEEDEIPMKTLFQEAEKYKPCTKCLFSGKEEIQKEFRGAYWYELEEHNDPLGVEDIEKKKEKLKTITKGKQIKFSTHPGKSFSIRDLKGTLDYWEIAEGFAPDVLVIDYADIMASDLVRGDEREKVNDTWVKLRALAQEKNILIITATQGNRGSIKKENLEGEDIGEDIRKIQHTTAAYGLNQNKKEKFDNILRVTPMVVREGECDENHHVRVLQCLSLTKPVIGSF